MAAALEVVGVRVAEGGTEILNGVDLIAERGQVLGILGPSGAGKTTLFRVLSGELLPLTGTVRLDGVDVTAYPIWQRARSGLGYLPQTPSVLFDLTVRSNIETFERAARATPRAVEERAALVELDARLDVHARDLSGGERRRLELLRVLISDPSVLIADEPFTGGDPTQVRTLARILRAHADRGKTVLIADHRVGIALDICDEAVLLADARIQLRVPAAEFAGHPAVRQRYLETSNP